MKNKLLLIAASLLSFAACKTNSPTAPDGIMLPLTAGGSGGSSTPAHPAIVFNDQNQYVTVMDSDGTHATELLSGHNAYGWSPGSSILMSGNPDSLYAADVSVNSSGVPVASNVRVIVSKSFYLSDSTTIGNNPAWSATSSVNKIAFQLRAIRNANRPAATICTQSASGGSWDTLHSFPSHYFVNGITWKADDSKIAVLLSYNLTTPAYSVVIMDASTGATTDSIPLPSNSTGWYGLQWSHGSSLNLLTLMRDTAYPGHSLDGDYIYYLTPSSESTPTTQNVGAYYNATWSPTSSSLMFETVAISNSNKCSCGVKWAQTLDKLSEQTTSQTKLQSQTNCCYSTYNAMDWHR